MLPDLSPAAADALRTALTRADHSTDGVRDLLGPAAHAAMGRGEVEPAFRVARESGELGVSVWMLLLGAVEPAAAVTPRWRRSARPGRSRRDCCDPTGRPSPPSWT